MEAYLNSVWDDIFIDIKDSIEDPEDRASLKQIINKAMIKNKNKIPALKPTVDTDIEQFKTKLDTGKGTTVSAYTLHWNQWKSDNPSKEFADPDDSSKKLSAHKYWQKHIWPKMSEADKGVWNEKAKELRTEIKKGGSSSTKEKRTVSKSAFQLFLEKMKTVMNNKDEEFTHPGNGQTVKLHHFLIYVWSTYIKDSTELKEPFETKAQEIKESDDGKYDLADLKYIDPEALRTGNFDDLELIEG